MGADDWNPDMASPRLKGKTHVRIERDRESRSCRVTIDGVDVSRSVSAVSWSLEAGRMAKATVTFLDVEIAADAEMLTEQTAAAAASEVEFRAVDLSVLDLRPGDTILLRHALRLDEAQIAGIKQNVVDHFPDNPVAVLDGGLELSVLRQEAADQMP